MVTDPTRLATTPASTSLADHLHPNQEPTHVDPSRHLARSIAAP